MTVGEANAPDAPIRRESPQSAQVDQRSLMRSPPTASHAINALVPDERPMAVRYLVAVGATVVALALTFAFAPYLQRVIFVLFWPAVIGAAWFGGIGPAILASTLSVLAADYFLIGTPGELALATADDLIPWRARPRHG
jgi:K+-sensing histidine kinase KdpD